MPVVCLNLEMHSERYGSRSDYVENRGCCCVMRCFPRTEQQLQTLCLIAGSCRHGHSNLPTGFIHSGRSFISIQTRQQIYQNEAQDLSFQQEVLISSIEIKLHSKVVSFSAHY